MAFKAYDALESVPQEHREHYAKGEDGKFRPNYDGAGDGWALENVKGLRTALGSERTRAEEAAKRLKAYEGLDAAKAREALEKVEEMARWTPEGKVREQIEARERALTEKHTKDISKRADRETALLRALDGATVTGAAVAALQKFDALPGAAEGLMPYIRTRVRMHEDDKGFRARVYDEAGNPAPTLRSGKTGDMEVEEFVESLKNHEVYGHFFKGSGAAGSGSQGAGARRQHGGAITITQAEAGNQQTYRAKKAAAEKAGVQLVYVD